MGPLIVFFPVTYKSQKKEMIKNAEVLNEIDFLKNILPKDWKVINVNAKVGKTTIILIISPEGKRFNDVTVGIPRDEELNDGSVIEANNNEKVERIEVEKQIRQRRRNSRRRNSKRRKRRKERKKRNKGKNKRRHKHGEN